MTRRLVAAAVVGAALAGGAQAASAAPKNPGQTRAVSHVSNMGLCAPYLGQLGVRPMVNELGRTYGPFLPDGPYENLGELYRTKAHEHPNASAESECVPRTPPPMP